MGTVTGTSARRARSCATVYLLTGAQHTLRAGIVRDDRELFHQIIVGMSVWLMTQFKCTAQRLLADYLQDGSIHPSISSSLHG